MPSEKVDLLEVNKNGLFDNSGLCDDILKKIEVMADAKGVLRCGLVWDISQEVKALKEAIKKEKELNESKIEELKRQLQTCGE